MRFGRPRRSDARTGLALPAVAVFCLALAACGRGGGDVSGLRRGPAAAAPAGGERQAQGGCDDGQAGPGVGPEAAEAHDAAPETGKGPSR